MTALIWRWMEITAAEDGRRRERPIDTPEQELFFNQQAQNYAAISYVKEGSTVSLPPTTYWLVGRLDGEPSRTRKGAGAYMERTRFSGSSSSRFRLRPNAVERPRRKPCFRAGGCKIIGFDMWVGDRDRGPGSNWEDLYALNVPPEPDANADLFLDGLLLGAGGNPGEAGSVVEGFLLGAHQGFPGAEVARRIVLSGRSPLGFHSVQNGKRMMIRTRTRKQLNASLVLLWLAISAGLSARAEAHAGGRVYPIPYLTDEMLEQIQLADGSVDEWYDLVGEPTMTLLDFADETFGSELDPSDLDFRIWLAWHDDPARLYLAFAAADDLYKNTHDYGSEKFEDSMYFQDGIFLAIDGDHSGGPGPTQFVEDESEPDALGFFGQTQFYTAIAFTGSGPTLDDEVMRLQTGNFAWTALPPYGEGGGEAAGESPTFNVIELYVTPFDRFGDWEGPEGSVVSQLQGGRVIGFGIVVNDWDPPERGVALTPEAMEPLDGLPPTFLVTQRRADSFIDGILLSPDPAGPETGTAAEPVSWGRIKASLEME